MELIGRLAVSTDRELHSDNRTQQLTLIERLGVEALEAEWLDRVQEQAGLPLFARRHWLHSWAEAFPEWEPWTLAVLHGSEVHAVAPLARRRTLWGLDIVPIGGGSLHESPVAARDDDALATLGFRLAGALRGLGRPWRLSLELSNASILAGVLASELPMTTLHPGCRRPILRFDSADSSSPKQLLGRNTYNAVGKARNRIEREGHRLKVGWEPITEALPEVVTVHRERDLELRGATLDGRDLRFFHQVIEHHIQHWRLLTVRIDGSLAGYVLGLKDRSSLRVWDNRLAPQWRRYSAGLIANAEVVLQARPTRSSRRLTGAAASSATSSVSATRW